MSSRMRLGSAVLGGLAGAAAVFLFDPQSGRRRRAMIADRSVAAMRRSLRSGERAARGMSADLQGQTRRAMHTLRPHAARPVANEATLADRVRSELFRDDAVPKGALNINVERECVVVLRGEVQRSEQIRDIESRVRRIPGVRDVENLMHLPGKPAKMHV